MTTPRGHPYLHLHPHTAWLLPRAEVMVALRTEGTPSGFGGHVKCRQGTWQGSLRCPGQSAVAVRAGENPAPLPSRGAHTRVLDLAQGTETYRGVSSEDQDGRKGPQRPPAWPCVATEVAWGLLRVMGGSTEAGPRLSRRLPQHPPAPFLGLP